MMVQTEIWEIPIFAYCDGLLFYSNDYYLESFILDFNSLVNMELHDNVSLTKCFRNWIICSLRQTLSSRKRTEAS